MLHSKFIRYYSIWLSVQGFYYKLSKWKRNIEVFLKTCSEHDINPFAFIDFIFLKKGGVKPWRINRIKMDWYNEFKELHSNASILDIIKEEEYLRRRALEFYRNYGLSEEELFLLTRGWIHVNEKYKKYYWLYNQFYNKRGIELIKRFRRLLTEA